MQRRAKIPASAYAVSLAGLLLLAACARETAPIPPPAAHGTPAEQKKCVVLLHGKGGHASPGSLDGDIEYLRPGGNGVGWGGREWRYFPEERYRQLRTSVRGALDGAGCARAVVQGFSNGGAAAAKLYCRGEDFDRRVIGYLIDDPVPDSGVLACQPIPGMHVQLYWTGALAIARAGWACASQDWTCEAGHTIGIERYAEALGTPAAPSIHTTHAPYDAPPEVAEWLR